MIRKSLDAIARAAFELGRDDILSDPNTDTILVAAAELAGDTETDLSMLEPRQVGRITAAFDRGQESLA